MDQDQQSRQRDLRRTTQDFIGQASQPPEREYNLQGGPEGLGTLVNGVIGDVQNIVRSEVRLAQAELKQDVGVLGAAAAMGGAAAVASIVGLIVLMIGVAILVDEWLSDWLAFILTGLALLIIAGVLAMIARNRVSAANLKPERTIESLQQDKAWAQDQAQSLKEDQS